MSSAFDLVQILIKHPDLSWENIASQVLEGSLRGRWGIPGNGPRDRIATSGEVTFTLRDPSQVWLGRIGSINPNTSWGIGTEFFIAFYFQGVVYYKKYGRIIDIHPRPHPGDFTTIDVTVGDWIDLAARAPIITPIIQANKRSDEAISAVLTVMADNPAVQVLDTGCSTFPTIFDITRQRGTAYAELAKIAISEVGYIYVKSDRINGEQLTFENFTHRGGLSYLSNMPDTDPLLDEAGLTLLDEAGNILLANSYTVFYQPDEHHAIEVSYGGDKIINRTQIHAYPRKMDLEDDWTGPPAGRVLYAITSGISIGSMETKVIEGSYTDPDGGGARVNAIDSTMIAPVAYTDYEANTEKDGTGTDITTDLTVTAVYSSSGVVFTVTNNNVKKGYINQLWCRGYGIYTYNPTTTTAESIYSAADYGWREITIDEPYQQDVVYPELEARRITTNYKNPVMEIESVSYHANRSDDLMNAFLGLDVGDMVRIKDTQIGIDNYYHIQQVEFQLYSKLFVDYTWTLKRQRTIGHGYKKVSIEGLGAVAGDGVSFGYIPQLSGSQRTFCCWAGIDTITQNYVLGGPFSDEAGAQLAISSAGKIWFYQKGATDAGLWGTAANTVTANHLYHICVSRDSSDPANKPVIYVDGVSKTVTEENPQGGATVPENNCNMFIMNAKTVTYDWPYKFDGIIYDFRIYTRILGNAEVANLANGSAEPSTANFVFHAPFCLDEQLPTYEGATLTAETKLLDAINGIVGAPHGSLKAHVFST